jgi:hypothetical protein
MSSFKSTFEFDARSIANFKRTMLRLKKIKDREDLIVKAAKSAVVPWRDTMRSNMYAGSIQKRTGKMAKSIGIQKYKDKRSGRVGAQAGPSRSRRSPDSKGGQGWRVHFFATPARQMKPEHRIPFQAIYRKKSFMVVRRMKINMKNVIEHVQNPNNPLKLL